MFSRILFLLLLAANIGMAAWLYVAPRQARPGVPPTDPGIEPLVLLAERDGGSSLVASAELAAAPQSRADAARDRCMTIGPFPSQADVRLAMTKITPQVERIQFKESRSRASRGFVVYLPAPATREQALEVARQLSAQGVRDYYVVTAGDAQNTISLGLFRDPANAQRRRAEVAALGFSPQVTERVEDLPVYWIDLAIGPDSRFNWRDYLPEYIDASAQDVPCV